MLGKYNKFEFKSSELSLDALKQWLSKDFFPDFEFIGFQVKLKQVVNQNHKVFEAKFEKGQVQVQMTILVSIT